MALTKIGCNSVLLSMVDVDNALQHIAWAGYDGVELAYIASMVEHLQPEQDQAARERLRRSAADLGLALYAIEVTPNTPERVEAACRMAAELAVPVVATGSGGKTGDSASFREAIDLAGQLAASAGRSGVTLALKPHVGAAVYNTATALQAWREVGSPHLGLNFDPSHLLRAGEDVIAAARQFTVAGAMVHSHFRDCLTEQLGGPPGPPEEQVPGRGRLDIPGILRALEEGGYQGALDLECIGAKRYPLARAMGIAAEARGYLRRCQQELQAGRAAGSEPASAVST